MTETKSFTPGRVVVTQSKAMAVTGYHHFRRMAAAYYHFIPVYMFPRLRAGLSKKLKVRMQGKSCFNFKAVDEALFKELEELTAEGFAAARKAGFGPVSVPPIPPDGPGKSTARVKATPEKS